MARKERGELVSSSVLDMQGLIYRRRYFVDDETGMELEGDQFRANRERDIEQAIKFAGPLSGRPQVSIDPAGNNTVVVVEIGSGTISPFDRSKPDLDAALDEAVNHAYGGSHEKALSSLPDLTPWELRCR